VLPTFGQQVFSYTPETKILENAAMSAFIRQDGTKFHFYTSAAQIATLQPGDVIVGTSGEGFLRKVVSVETVNGELIVETVDATLEDVIAEGTINLQQELTAANLVSVTPLMSGVKVDGWMLNAAGVYQNNPSTNAIPLTLPSISLDCAFEGNNIRGDKNVKIEVIGNIQPSLSLDFAVSLQKNSLGITTGIQEFKTVFLYDEVKELSVKLDGDISKDFFGPEDVAVYDFAPIIIGPVVIIPKFVVSVGVEGKASGKLESIISLRTTHTKGMHYIKGRGWKPIDTHTQPHSQYEPLKDPVTASLKGYAVAEFSLKLYGVAGPYVSLEGYLKALLYPEFSNLTLNIKAKLYAGFEAKLGAKVEVLSWKLADFYMAVGYEWKLLERDLLAENPSSSTPPGVPSGVTVAVVSPTQISVKWDEPSGDAIGYNVYRGGTLLPMTSVTMLSLIDNRLQPATRYCYQVSALGVSGYESGRSSQACVTTPPDPDTTVPTVPANLTATAVSSTQINLTWTASTDNVGVAGYIVYRYGASLWHVRQVATNSLSDTGLVASTQYCYQVSAYDAVGNESGKSAEVCATTLAGTGTGGDPFDGKMVLVRGGTFTMCSIS